MEREIRTITMFGKECRIQKIGDNLWDFLDIPIKSKVYDTWDTAKKYNSNWDGNNNNLEKLIPQIKDELEKNNLKIGKIWIPSKEEYEGGISFYSEPDNRIKFYDGDSYWYWTSTPGLDRYYYWCSVVRGGYLVWSGVSDAGGVSFAFHIDETDTNDDAKSVIKYIDNMFDRIESGTVEYAELNGIKAPKMNIDNPIYLSVNDNEIDTNEAITSVENNIDDKMPEDVKEKDVPAEEYHKLEYEIEKLKALVVEQALEISELKRR